MIGAESFNDRQLDGMYAAGDAVELVSDYLQAHDLYADTHEFVVVDEDSTFAVVVEGGVGVMLPLPFHEIWDGIAPVNGENYGDLPAMHVGTVYTGPPLGTTREEYHLYQIADPDSNDTQGVIIAAELELRSELVPAEELNPGLMPGDETFVEVVEARPVTGYYITDANGAHTVTKALLAAMQRGIDLNRLFPHNHGVES